METLTRPDRVEYFMQMARVVALRGSCRRKQVGSVIVDTRGAVVSTGYNGAPRRMPDCLEVGCDVRVIDGRESCVRTLHAESNAIDFARVDLTSATLYTSVVPCRLCALRVIQAGINCIWYEEWYESQGTKDVAALLAQAGVELNQWTPGAGACGRPDGPAGLTRCGRPGCPKCGRP